MDTNINPELTSSAIGEKPSAPLSVDSTVVDASVDAQPKNDITSPAQSNNNYNSDQYNQRRTLMADTTSTTFTTDPSYLILQGESDIRSDIKGSEAHIRHNVVKAESDIRQDVAKGEADIRYDLAKSESDIRQEVASTESELKGLVTGVESELKSDIKEAQYELVKESFKMADRNRDQATQYFIASSDKFYQQQSDLAALRAAQDANFAKVASDANHLADKTIAHSDLAAERLAYKMLLDGDKTRELINSLNTESLNRKLIEQNAKLVDARHESRFWEHGCNQSQFASVMSQMQNFQSQLQETRQGLVNFGTMAAGAGTQSSTSNNVR